MEQSDTLSQPQPTVGEGRIKDRRTPRSRDIFAIIVMAGDLVCVILIRHAAYVYGLNNENTWGIHHAVTFTIVFSLLTGIVVISALCRLLSPPYTLCRVSVGASRVMLPLLVFVASFLLIRLARPAYLNGFRNWAVQNVDVGAIQRWLATNRSELASYSGGPLDPRELPEFMVDLGSPWITVKPSIRGEPVARFAWGGRVNRELVVGPPTMEVPKNRAIEVRPGAYVSF